MIKDEMASYSIISPWKYTDERVNYGITLPQKKRKNIQIEGWIRIKPLPWKKRMSIQIKG